MEGFSIQKKANNFSFKMRANSVLDTKPKEHNLKQIAVNGSQRKIEQPCILTPN